MLLLLMMNLGMAWGVGVAPAVTAGKNVGSPRSAGSMRARG
jgi:hypothetical protein